MSLLYLNSMEKERHETWVSALSDVSDRKKKELLFVSLSMEKERQETCVSALSDVSDTLRKGAPLCFSFYGERETGDLCLCSI